jgi:hypothetical protein
VEAEVDKLDKLLRSHVPSLLLFRQAQKAPKLRGENFLGISSKSPPFKTFKNLRFPKTVTLASAKTDFPPQM